MLPEKFMLRTLYAVSRGHISLVSDTSSLNITRVISIDLKLIPASAQNEMISFLPQFPLVSLHKEETVLQGMIDKLIETGRYYGMEMNVEKTEVMRI